MANENFFKVCVESLHVNKIKEINYEGEETLQEKPTVSQRLTELAQRVDFTDCITADESEPPLKKSTQKWPWDVPHSKLKQALTEISVLSDVLQIIQHHSHYIAMDPVLSSPAVAPTPVQQLLVKKKALEKAGEVLRQGTATLSKNSTRGDVEFHQALSIMRKRWRLRRLNGVIVADLGYHSAGTFTEIKMPIFSEVQKSERESGVLDVRIPQELRGKSEIAVFLSEQPVCELPSLTSLTPSLIDHHAHERRQGLSGWECKLLDAQNMLFNKELFSIIAKEAYNQKPMVQHQVCSNKINVLLGPKCWLSVLHIREYDSGQSDLTPLPDGLSPNWALVVALKQLLREKQTKVSMLSKPQPSTLGFTAHSKLSSACVVPNKEGELRALMKESGIFSLFLEKARHLYNEGILHEWLTELCNGCEDPVLRISWQPDRSLAKTMYFLAITGSLDPTQRRKVLFTLIVDKLHLEQFDGSEFTLDMEKDRVLCAVQHQILFHQLQMASIVAKEKKWVVLQQFERPLLSSSMLQSDQDYLMACSLSLQSPDGHRKLDIQLQWETVSVSLTHFASKTVTSAESVDSIAPTITTLVLGSQYGQNFQQKFYNLLNTLS